MDRLRKSIPAFSRLSLLWKILLSTSLSITALFGLLGWVVLAHAVNTTRSSLDAEVKASFQVYDSLWRSREKRLASVSRVLASMSDVRAAFGTRDAATIRDTAAELWKRVSEENAIFLVTDASGGVIASLGGRLSPLPRELEVVRQAEPQFPQQVTGFLTQNDALYQVVVTPVYLESGRGPALWNVLVAGFQVDQVTAESLKQSTGSEFLFVSRGHLTASTLPAAAAARLVAASASGAPSALVSDGASEYAPLRTVLLDIERKPVGELWILRSFDEPGRRVAALRRDIILLWLAAVVIAVLLTYIWASRIVRPVEELVRAAENVSRQNYDSHVPVTSQDELGTLARTFNSMCESIRAAREDLIRQERISTIARMSSSIVHDLRNPLAAIYAGAEMLADAELPPHHVKRLAGSIYQASRTMQQLLQDLLDMSRRKTGSVEPCRLTELACAARDSLAASAEACSVEIRVEVPETIELPLQRSRVERVFLNLIGNAIEAMPGGGWVRIDARQEGGQVLVAVEDNGPGINAAVRDQLFKPFGTSGKKNGLGLGLALSRQAIQDNGGDLWLESGVERGARFVFRLPLVRTGAPAIVETAAK